MAWPPEATGEPAASRDGGLIREATGTQAPAEPQCQVQTLISAPQMPAHYPACSPEGLPKGISL